jgi:GDP-4-dehydro-6-deoxy-D-mannose reductase
MKKILITGISGFVGGHFCDDVFIHRKDLEIHGISRSEPSWNFVTDFETMVKTIHFRKADLMDNHEIYQAIREIEPDYILHLAAQSSVAESWKSPVSSFLNNTNIFLNVIDAVRRCEVPCTILSVGSSEQYGIVTEQDLPLREDRPLAPANPYAVARVAQEQLARIYAAGYGMDICCTRSFNHCGPGQSPHFVISSIVQQFIRAVQKEQEPVISIGNGSIVRDFLDIHDVVSAYTLLLEKGKSGEVYNICSGEGHTIRDVVHLLAELFEFPVTIVEERSRFRPIYEKIRNDLGWYPRIPFEESLRSIYRYWSEHSDQLAREWF